MSTKMIRTFIFLDLETTGLIRGNCMPKVTEISLIAVSRNAIRDVTGVLPRVQQKLVLAINPNIAIPKDVENLTGLTNNYLEDAQCFNTATCDLLIKFLSWQMAPICLVAYNGNRFDYPILLSHLKNVNQTLSEDILSIDMMLLVKELFSPKRTRKLDYDNLLNDGYDEVLSTALDTTLKCIRRIDDKDQCGSTKECTRDINVASSSLEKRMQAVNEKTPEKPTAKLSKVINRPAMINAKRQLKFTDSPPSNFKLDTVFKHFCGTKSENLHTAEGDCLSMIHCAVRIQDFVQLADSKAVPLIKFSKV